MHGTVIPYLQIDGLLKDHAWLIYIYIYIYIYARNSHTIPSD